MAVVLPWTPLRLSDWFTQARPVDPLRRWALATPQHPGLVRESRSAIQVLEYADEVLAEYRFSWQLRLATDADLGRRQIV